MNSLIHFKIFSKHLLFSLYFKEQTDLHGNADSCAKVM